MTLELLKKLIQERVQEIDKPYQKDKWYDRCREYIENNKFTKIEDLLEIDAYELARLYLLVNNDNSLSDEECEDLLEEIIDYFDSLDIINVKNLIDIMSFITYSNQKDKILACIREKEEKKVKGLIDQVDFDVLELRTELPPSERKGKFKEFVGNLRKLYKELDVVTIVEHFEDFHNLALQAVFALIEAKKQLEHDQKNIEETIQNYPAFLHTKAIKKAKKDYYKLFYATRDILGTHQLIVNYVTNEDQKESKSNRDVQREKVGYQTALKLLETAMTQPEITNARAIIKTVRNEEIKKAFLELIYRHNEKYYQSLETRLMDLKKNSINGYIARLKQIGINVDTNEAKLVMHNSMDELDEMIQIVTKLPLLEEEIKMILKTSNIEIVRRIKEYIDKGYITPEFAYNNLKLWDQQSPLLQKIELFYKEIQKWNINPQLFVNSYDVLLDTNHCVIKNIELLDQYGFIRNLKNANNLNFLAQPKMIEILDQMIENGIVQFISEDIELLNSTNVARLSLLRQMHFEIDSLEDCKEVLFTKKFMIPDDSIDRYISKAKPENLISLSLEPYRLEELRKDRWSYQIGEILVSSHKVERLQQEGATLEESIFEGLIMNEEELEEMLKILGKYTKK